MIHILSQSFSLSHCYYLLHPILSQNHYTTYDYKDTLASNPKNTQKYCVAHLHKGARMVVAHDVPQPRSSNSLGRSHREWVDLVLTISKLKRWSINYYIDTARGAETASRDLARAGGGLGEYYSEHETRTPTWLLAGDAHTVATLVGLADAQRAGGEADAQPVARWLDDGVTPNGAHGRAFGQRGVHGFDLTFCAPKSVSLVRALRGDDDVLSKAIADAHATALSEAMEYLTVHASYADPQPAHRGERSGAASRVSGHRLPT